MVPSDKSKKPFHCYHYKSFREVSILKNFFNDELGVIREWSIHFTEVFLINNPLREPKNRHEIEYSTGWCGTCDDLAKPNSNDKMRTVVLNVKKSKSFNKINILAS